MGEVDVREKTGAPRGRSDAEDETGGFGILPVVQPDRDDAQGAGDQFVGPATLVAMARHPIHRTVQAFVQPALQEGRIVLQFHAGDADPLEARRMRQRADALGQCGGVGQRAVHARSTGAA